MKLEALDHPKTYDFAARLGVSMPTAVGYLEFFWAFVAKKTPHGDVGKWPNGAIARSCYWDGDPDQFVECLVGAGFVDKDDSHRLVVHDWQDHMPNWVRAKLKKLGERIVSAQDISSHKSDDICSDDSEDSSSDLSSNLSSDLSGYSVREGKGREVKPPLAPPSGEREKSSRGTRLPENWTLPEGWELEARRIVKAANASVTLSVEADKFRDYWLGLSGSRGVKKDWLATWRNWVRNACERTPQRRIQMDADDPMRGAL